METKLKYSDAIRLGAMLKPKGTGSCYALSYNYDLDQSVEVTCANGAALDAIGKLTGESSDMIGVGQYFPVSNVSGHACPVCGAFKVIAGMTNLRWMVAHINDAHEWTREQIADWVEGIEMAEEAKHEIPEPALCTV